jgi:hypothetical protein
VAFAVVPPKDRLAFKVKVPKKQHHDLLTSFTYNKFKQEREKK